MPLPAGLSGAVTTPTILNPAVTNASKEATAKSGVPIKTIRGFNILYLLYPANVKGIRCFYFI
jgi:hypothetical protein